MIISSLQPLFDCRPHAYTYAYIHPYSYIPLCRHLCTYVSPHGSVWVCIYVHIYISLWPLFVHYLYMRLGPPAATVRASGYECMYIYKLHQFTYICVCMYGCACMRVYLRLAGPSVCASSARENPLMQRKQEYRIGIC